MRAVSDLRRLCRACETRDQNPIEYIYKFPNREIVNSTELVDSPLVILSSYTRRAKYFSVSQLQEIALSP